MKRRMVIILLALPLLIHAQGQTSGDSRTTPSIEFETGMSWQQVLTKAQAVNKHIFVDCYATWCGPCRYMADSIFTRAEAADFMNRHFINVSFQIDTTAKDPSAIKERYHDAKLMVEKYQVTALPTFLFFTSDGECIYRAVGGFADATSFVAKAVKALDPDEQYFFLLEQYNKGRKEPPFISRLLEAARKFGDEEMVTKLKKERTNPEEGNTSPQQK